MSTATEETAEVPQPTSNKWVYLFEEGSGDEESRRQEGVRQWGGGEEVACEGGRREVVVAGATVLRTAR